MSVRIARVRTSGARSLIGLALICVLAGGAVPSAARVLPGETGCGMVALRGAFAGRAGIVVIRHRTDCATARRVARRAASQPTVYGAPAPAPPGWTCVTSMRASLGYILRHAVTCQRGRNLQSIDRPAVAIALPDDEWLHCGDVRVNRFLRAHPRGLFGAFGIIARGDHVDCPAARSIASRYVHQPTERKTTHLNGWTCTQKSLPEPQAMRVSCTRRHATVAFTDKVPNG